MAVIRPDNRMRETLHKCPKCKEHMYYDMIKEELYCCNCEGVSSRVNEFGIKFNIEETFINEKCKNINTEACMKVKHPDINWMCDTCSKIKRHKGGRGKENG